jgi:peptide deformylase
MALLEIVKYPDPLLRNKSTPVEEFDDSLLDTLNNMVETMHDANGIGLAGVQVAFLKRALVIDIGHIDENDDDSTDPEQRSRSEKDRSRSSPEFYINPEILKREDSTEYEEGCLSIPGVYGKVSRSAKIWLRYQNEKGEVKETHASGLRAIVLQHEIDHLNGVLFFDHLGALTRSMLLAKYKKNQK